MKIIEFVPTYIKVNGVVVVYGKSVPFPENFKPILDESGSVVITPDQFGGNHKHPRVEVFYTSGDLTIVWIDGNSQKHEESMAPDKGKYKLFITEPNEPHAIINKTQNPQILIEYASEPQRDVEVIKLYNEAQ